MKSIDSEANLLQSVTGGSIVHRDSGYLKTVHPSRVFVSAGAAMLALVLLTLWTTPAWAQNPFQIDGDVPNAGPGIVPSEFSDPFGNAQELGPVNGNPTKLGAIHNAASPMLAFTNPNGQTDIVAIWLATKKALDGDTWLYFAWQRDASKGSSVIAYEFQEADVPINCNYDGLDMMLPEEAGETNLIANCNPWSGRAEDDFMIVWDFKGGATDIVLRTFDGMVFDSVLLTGVVDGNGNPIAHAALNQDTSRGEGAVNLSETIFKADPNNCTSVGNVLTGTITGNSDSADYKDTLLADFTGDVTISNCGVVKITKNIIPANEPGNFTFNHNLILIPPDASDTSFILMNHGSSKTYDNVAPSVTSYVITEADPTASNFDLFEIDCDKSNITVDENLGNRSVTFDFAVGDQVDCTFTNRKRGKILVDKVTVPAGSSQKFTFNPSWGSNFMLADGDAKADSGYLVPGSYSVAELTQTGWDLTSATCSDGTNNSIDPAAISLGAGQVVTCTFTNTQRGKILVDKVTLPAGSAQKFTFNPSWGASFDLADADAANDSGFLVPGNYSVSESSLTGWDLTSASCDDNDATTGPDAINLDPGETVTCTFTNTQRGRILVDKVTTPANDPTKFTFSPSWGSQFMLADQDAKADSGYLLPGVSHSVSEGPTTGWVLTSSSCSNGDSPSNIVLDPNETVTCTFNNALQTGAIRISKRRKFADAPADEDPADQPHPGVVFEISGGSLVTPVPLPPTGADGTVCYDAGGAGLPFSSVVGNYIVKEIIPTGYIADGDLSETPGNPGAPSPPTFEKTVTLNQVGLCADDDPPTAQVVHFSNTPLTNVTVTADAIDAGATRSHIACYHATEVDNTIVLGDLIEEDPDTGFEDGAQVDLENLQPGYPDSFVICKIEIDP